LLIISQIVEKLDIDLLTDQESSFALSTEMEWYRWIRSESLKRYEPTDAHLNTFLITATA
jgi:hypothetical protein